MAIQSRVEEQTSATASWELLVLRSVPKRGPVLVALKKKIAVLA